LNDAVRLAPSSRFDALPSHSPDGSLIAFISNRTGQLELWLTKPDGSGLTRLTENSHIASTPRWSPDGKRLVYGSAAPPAEGKPTAYGLYVLRFGGGLPTPVPITQPSPSDPFWSPDGESIYYWSGSQLWRTRLNGNDSVQIGDYRAHFVRPGVIHEGQMYYTRPSKPFALVRTALEGGEQILADGLASPFFAISGNSFITFGTRTRGFACSPSSPDRRALWAYYRKLKALAESSLGCLSRRMTRPSSGQSPGNSNWTCTWSGISVDGALASIGLSCRCSRIVELRNERLSCVGGIGA
jgi:dipeptidyl aminopeptidase/acylaminoacyl peptidase